MARPSSRLTAPTFRWFALADFVAMIVIVVSGAAVRLTGSGLGCPDWPTCYRHRLTGSWSLHPLVEYGNRIVTVTLVIVTIVTFLASLRRSPRRRDLVALSGTLVLGVVADAVLGAFVVYSKLNPWLVSIHLLLSLAMVVVGAVLYHHAKYVYGPDARAEVRDPHIRRLAQALWIPFAVLLFTGTVTTGSGPHAGSSQGQLVARRLPFGFSQATWIHSVAATLFIGLVLGLLFAIWTKATPAPVRFGVRRLAVIAGIQALIGVVQYLTKVPALLVELHVIGATSLTIGMTQFSLRQSARDREPGTRRA